MILAQTKFYDMPARSIPKNYQNLTGVVYNSKCKRLSAFESTLERDCLIVLDFDRDVHRYEEQPVTINYDLNGEHRRYTPDVLIHYHTDLPDTVDRIPELCEIKYRDDLRDHWQKYKARFKAARRYAKAQGWRFRIITEREIRTPYLENARFLRPYRDNEADNPHCTLLLERLHALRETDPQTLIASFYRDRWNQAQVIPALWHLVATGYISTDLTLPLNMHSRLWLDTPC